MYVSVVVWLCLYAYRFRDTFLIVNLVNKESESESERKVFALKMCACLVLIAKNTAH